MLTALSHDGMWQHVKPLRLGSCRRVTGRALAREELLRCVPVEGGVVDAVMRCGNQRASWQQEASKGSVAAGAHLGLANAYGRVHPQGLLRMACISSLHFQRSCLAEPPFTGTLQLCGSHLAQALPR